MSILFKGLFLFTCLAYSVSGRASLPTSLPTADNGYYVFHTIKTLSADGRSCTLDDNSVWYFFNPVNTEDWPQGLYTVWIVPNMEGPFLKDERSRLMAVFFKNNLANSVWGMLLTGSTTLTIASFDSSTGIVTLSDQSQWKLSPYYKKFYSDWQASDPITVAGRRDEYYLINGNERDNGLNMTYALARKHK